MRGGFARLGGTSWRSQLSHRKQRARLGGQGDEGLRGRRRVGAAGRGGHHQRQARVLQPQRPGARRHGHVDRAGKHAVRMDVAGVGAAGLEDVHPQAVELQPAARTEVEGQVLGEPRRMPVQPPLQLAEHAGALRQVIERGVGGVAAVAVSPAPGPPALSSAASIRQAASSSALKAGNPAPRPS